MITKRQKQVIDFIKSFSVKYGYSPSLEEIKKHLHLASVSTAHHHVKSLEELGLLKKKDNQPRGIAVYEFQQMIQIPILGRISAGQPILAIEEKEYISIPFSQKEEQQHLFALRVAGQSMVDENINDGDIVVIRNQNTAENGQKIVALLNREEVTLKKFFKEDNKVRLQPANQAYSPIIVDPENLIIQGIVVDVIKYIGESDASIISEPNIKPRNDHEDLRKTILNKIICGNCTTELGNIPSNSIDSCITDPPYNYEFVGHNWNADEIKRRTDRIQNSKTLIKHIPYGSGLAGGVRNERWYKKNADNIQDYQNWCHIWGKEVFRVLKPGAYILVFNSTRTVAHVQVAMEKAGFYARDIIVWRKNSGIPKGLNFVNKLKKEGYKNTEKWEGWHSCLRNEWEAIVMLQKPLDTNYLETVKKYDVGLLQI